MPSKSADRAPRCRGRSGRPAGRPWPWLPRNSAATAERSSRRSKLDPPAPRVDELRGSGQHGHNEDDGGDGGAVAEIVLAEPLLVEPGAEDLAAVVRAACSHHHDLVEDLERA